MAAVVFVVKDAAALAAAEAGTVPAWVALGRIEAALAAEAGTVPAWVAPA